MRPASPALAMTGDRAPDGWLARLRAWREDLLASPAFQRWAARFPLTRPIARRHARALFDLCAGFVYSQVLLACVQLELLRACCGAGRRPRRRWPRRCSCAPTRPRCLLRAAASLRLVERRDGGPLRPRRRSVRRCSATPASLAMIEHHALLYADLADPVALLRARPRRHGARAATGPTPSPRRPASCPPAQVRRVHALMAGSQPLVAERDPRRLSDRGHRCLLDVGGGDGTFLAAAAARCAAAAAACCSTCRPSPQRRSAASPRRGSAARAQLTGGDFLQRSAAARRRPRHAGAGAARPRRRRWCCASCARCARALPADGRVADRRADGRHPRRRADGRRLFRLLPAGDGPRPAADARANWPRCCEAAGFARRQCCTAPTCRC